MRHASTAVRNCGKLALVVAVASSWSGAPSFGQTPAASGARVAWDNGDMPPAAVEMDLGPGLIRQAIGLGDAALAGFLEGLATSPNADTSANIEFVIGQLTSTRELGNVASEVVQEVHVRVWQQLEDENDLATKLIAHFDSTLIDELWQSTLRVRQPNETVCLYVHRQEESVDGVLLVAGKQREVVAINLVGDLSPEKVQRLTATATKIGVNLGLDKELEKAVEKLRSEIGRR